MDDCTEGWPKNGKVNGISKNPLQQLANAVSAENRGRSMRKAEITTMKIAVLSKASSSNAKSTGSQFAALAEETKMTTDLGSQ